jgi:hypothetical protein
MTDLEKLIEKNGRFNYLKAAINTCTFQQGRLEKQKFRYQKELDQLSVEMDRLVDTLNGKKVENV